MIEQRRRARWSYLLVVGSFVFIAVLLERLVIPWQSVLSFKTDVIVSLIDMMLVATALFATMRADPGGFIEPCRTLKRTSSAIEPALQAETAALLDALNNARIYREHH